MQVLLFFSSFWSENKQASQEIYTEAENKETELKYANLGNRQK